MAVKSYPPEVFEAMARCLREQDEKSQKWLQTAGYVELHHLVDAIDGMEISFRWLVENGYRPYAAVVDGLNGKDTAKAWLLKSGYPALAAFIEATEGSQRAVEFLAKAGEHGWIRVARALHQREKKKEKNFFWNLLNFGNPFR